MLFAYFFLFLFIILNKQPSFRILAQKLLLLSTRTELKLGAAGASSPAADGADAAPAASISAQQTTTRGGFFLKEDPPHIAPSKNTPRALRTLPRINARIKIIDNSRAPTDRCVDSIARQSWSASPAESSAARRRWKLTGRALGSTPPPAAAAEQDWASDGAPWSLAAVGWWCRGNRSVRLCSETRTSPSAAWVTLHCSGGAKATCLSATCTGRDPSCCSHC